MRSLQIEVGTLPIFILRWIGNATQQSEPVCPIQNIFSIQVDKIHFLQETTIDKFNFLQEHDMSLKHPALYYPELSDYALQSIAEALLDVRFSTYREMNSRFDDNYTRETAVFGRSKNMLIEMALERRFGTTLLHAGMDVTFKVGEVPCRFFRDDPSSPEKAGFFKRNAVDGLFSIDDQHPVLWRFIVEKALTELLKTHPDLDAIFALNNNIATALLIILKSKQFAEKGIKIKIACFDDIDLFNIIDKSVISVSQPIEEIGKNASVLLLDIMDGKQTNKSNIVLSTKLIER